MSIQDHEDLDCARSSEYALRLRSGFDHSNKGPTFLKRSDPLLPIGYFLTFGALLHLHCLVKNNNRSSLWQLSTW